MNWKMFGCLWQRWIHAFAPFCSAPTGFLDSSPPLLWFVWRSDLGRSPFAAVFPEFIARDRGSRRRTGRQGGKRRGGAARRQSRGHGPVRLDGQAPTAKVAREGDEGRKTVLPLRRTRRWPDERFGDARRRRKEVR